MATSNVDITKYLEKQDPNNDGDDEKALPYCGSVPIVQQMLGKAHDADGRHEGFCAGARKQTLPISTAAHLSARFPVSNPTGVVETRNKYGAWKRHFFVDGGYMDNSGALTGIQSVEALKVAARELNKERENKKISVNVIVLSLYALRIPDVDDTNNEESRPKTASVTKQSEFTAIPSAALKARGASGRTPIRMLCQSLQDDDERAAIERCDEIFRRRSVSQGDADKVYRQNIDLKSRPCPTHSILYEGIPLRAPKNPTENQTGIQNATWIPVPLEVAAGDKQKNAITALLGWTLLEETSKDINTVMNGAAQLVFDEYNEAILFKNSNITHENLFRENTACPQ